MPVSLELHKEQHFCSEPSSKIAFSFTIYFHFLVGGKICIFPDAQLAYKMLQVSLY